MRLYITQNSTYRLDADGQKHVLSLFVHSGYSTYDLAKAVMLREGQVKRWLAGETGLPICFVIRIGQILGFSVNERKELTNDNPNTIRKILSEVA